VVTRVDRLDLAKLEPLRKEALAEGYSFVERLASEYADGSLRFDKSGEALFAIFEDEELMAIGGLTGYEALRDPTIGRVRRLYVLDRCRRHGYGRLIVEAIIEEARKYYRLLTLRTPNALASAFYERLGFQTAPPVAETTHWIKLV